MDEDKNIKPEGFSDKALENHSYVWSENIRLPALALDHLTIKRARPVGIEKLLLEFARDGMAAVQQLGIREYNYEDMARIVGALQNAISPFQKRYHGPNIEIGSFISPDTGALNTIYLSDTELS